jgi:hypothetical protein
MKAEERGILGDGGPVLCDVHWRQWVKARLNVERTTVEWDSKRGYEYPKDKPKRFVENAMAFAGIA